MWKEFLDGRSHIRTNLQSAKNGRSSITWASISANQVNLANLSFVSDPLLCQPTSSNPLKRYTRRKVSVSQQLDNDRESVAKRTHISTPAKLLSCITYACKRASVARDVLARFGLVLLHPTTANPVFLNIFAPERSLSCYYKELHKANVPAVRPPVSPIPAYSDSCFL